MWRRGQAYAAVYAAPGTIADAKQAKGHDDAATGSSATLRHPPVGGRQSLQRHAPNQKKSRTALLSHHNITGSDPTSQYYYPQSHMAR